MLLIGSVFLAGLGAFLLRLRTTLRLAFAPLDDMARELGTRRPPNIEPVSTRLQPEELMPVIDAFNAMMVRVRRALQHEQRFTADAAHELRTPLASLSVLLHNASEAESDGARDEALAQMREVVKTSGRLVDQLLALARYDHAPAAFELDRAIDLRSLAGQVLTELRPQADARHMRLSLHAKPETASPDIVARGNCEALHVLMRNLVDNALRFAPVGGMVELTVDADATRREWRIEVDDNGPGIPPDWQERVTGRFVRATGQEVPGTGLGLAIVDRIAELHGGRLQLGPSARLGGTLASVTLPMPSR
jgi:signal transduction histidine kinase